MGQKHDEVARRIAKQEGVPYNPGQGPDVQGRKRIVEVETKGTVKDGLRQLRGFKKPVFIAGADKAAVERALEATKNTTVGVMDEHGKVVKRSTRGKK